MSIATARGSAAAITSGKARPLPWEKISLAILLTATAAAFLWGLDRNGWANPYYSAAAQAGSQDWKAFFFGSLDAGNIITVDKPPLSIWIMALSVRLFGLNSWALLVPQALMGVSTTWLIYKIVRRTQPAGPALLGGLIYATTPVVVLMSRYNNPEPLMGLLTVAGVYFVLRAVENNQWKWYLLAGTSLGLGFMAKQIQAFLPVPALLIAVTVFGVGTLASRLLRMIGCLTALIVSGGWWMAIVELTPAMNRPYVGGTATNSVLELTLDYNGLARFLRFAADPATGRAVPAGDSDPYDGGLGRLFNANFAPEGAWLLMTALLCSLALVVLWRQPERTRASKASIVASVVWLLTTYSVLSFMGTMTHTYYTFSLAAPIALTVPIGIFFLWNQRLRVAPRLIGAVLLAGTGYVASRIFQYSDDWGPVPIADVCVTTLAVLVWLLASRKWMVSATLAVAVALVLAPVATDVITLGRSHEGTNPLSGPVGNNPDSLSAHLMQSAKSDNSSLAKHLGFGVDPSPVVADLLRQSTSSRWGAATYTAQNAARYQLASGRPAIAVGGWLGGDPAPTLEQFKAMVRKGDVAYFIGQQIIVDQVPLGEDAAAITEWVQSSFRGEIVDGVTIYDLRG